MTVNKLDATKRPEDSNTFRRERSTSKSALFKRALCSAYNDEPTGLEELTEPDPVCHHAMLETLDELETQEQTVLSLYHVEDFDDQEIGEVFGWREERAVWKRQRVISKIRRGWTMRLSVALAGEGT